MNSYEAKQIPIQDFLAREGFRPTATKQSELWYKSPLRDERTPSFKVNLILNTFFDFGANEGGTIIDLVCLMYRESVKDALTRLESKFGTSRTYEKPYSIERKTGNRVFEIVEIKKITHPALFYYLKERCIDFEVANKYLKQIDFKVRNKSVVQFALGFENNIKGEFEFRNKFMKGFLGSTKDITSINIQAGNRVLVFEGFFDFLSYLTDHNIRELKDSVIVFNSTMLEKKARKILESVAFSEVCFFLDNDNAGEISFQNLSAGLHYHVNNKSIIYFGFKDYNEYLVNKNANKQ